MTHRGRALAALLAVLALVSLVHWHPLFEDSGSETLRDAPKQCTACATGAGPAPEPATSPITLAVLAPVTAELAASLASNGALRISIPRAPPC